MLSNLMCGLDVLENGAVQSVPFRIFSNLYQDTAAVAFVCPGSAFQLLTRSVGTFLHIQTLFSKNQ